MALAFETIILLKGEVTYFAQTIFTSMEEVNSSVTEKHPQSVMWSPIYLIEIWANTVSWSHGPKPLISYGFSCAMVSY